jgi:hypothetical protein
VEKNLLNSFIWAFLLIFLWKIGPAFFGCDGSLFPIQFRDYGEAQATSSICVASEQCDQTGRIFAYWMIIHFYAVFLQLQNLYFWPKFFPRRRLGI